MSDKQLKVCKKSDFLTLWELLNRWKAIPKKVFERLINDKILPIYENLTKHNVYRESNKLYLERFEPQNNIFISPFNGEGERKFCMINNTIPTNLGVFILEKAMNLDKIELEDERHTINNPDYIPRFFFLLSDVKKLEQQNPEYIDPKKAKPSKKPAKPTIAELQAELEKANATIAEKEATIAELREQIEKSFPIDNINSFLKAFPLIGIVANYHKQGLNNAEIGLKLTKELNPCLTIVQAGVLIADDTNSRNVNAVKNDYYSITENQKFNKKYKR